MRLICVLVLVAVVFSLPNPFALGTKWPQDVPRKKFYCDDLSVAGKNPWADIVKPYRKEIISAVKTAKNVLKDDLQTISANYAAFFPDRYLKQIDLMYNALSDNGKHNDITTQDLYILNIWYDLTVGDGSTTLVSRKYDFGDGHPVLGFAFNSGAVRNQNDYVHRSKDMLMDLVVGLDYIDSHDEVIRTTITLAGWVGCLAGVSYTGANGYAMTYSANYHTKVPSIHTMIAGWTNHYVLPSIYLREIMEQESNYHDAVNYVKAGIPTKLPLFMTIVGSGSVDAEIFVTDGEILSNSFEFTRSMDMMLQDDTDVREAVSPTDKWIAVREAITPANVNQAGFLGNVLKLYPIRDEDTVFLMYADPAKGEFGAQLQKCEYIRSFNDEAHLVIEACQDPPAPVNLAVPLISFTIFSVVICLFGWGVFEKRRQNKAIDQAAKDNSYTEISDEEETTEADNE